MKKLLITLVCILLLFALASCDLTDNGGNQPINPGDSANGNELTVAPISRDALAILAVGEYEVFVCNPAYAVRIRGESFIPCSS